MEGTNLAELYHSPLLDWSRIEARLQAGLTPAPGTGGLGQAGLEPGLDPGPVEQR